MVIVTGSQKYCTLTENMMTENHFLFSCLLTTNVEESQYFLTINNKQERNWSNVRFNLHSLNRREINITSLSIPLLALSSF